MNELIGNTIVSYKVALGPFLMMTSCATLVWALQNRFSRLVHTIRALNDEGTRENIDYSHSADIQIKDLKRRSRILRDSITGLYAAMSCYLVSVMLLTLSHISSYNLSIPTVSIFLIGLSFMTISLSLAISETAKSFGSLEEDVSTSL